MGVERPRRSEERARLIPWRGREGRDRRSPTRQTRRRRTPAAWLARSACDLAPAMWVVTLGQDRLRAWGAHRVGPRCRAAAGANPSLRMPKAKELELMSPFCSTQPHEAGRVVGQRSEEHTSELQSLMRNSYDVFCLKKKKHKVTQTRV